MFAVVIQKAWYQRLAFNWFDVALVGLLVFGFWRGRKRGMTKEFLPTLQWVAILLGAGFGHIYLADWLQHEGLVRQVFGNKFNEHTAALMSAYLAIALMIFVVFVTLRRKFNPKLEGSNFFGGNEYYLGHSGRHGPFSGHRAGGARRCSTRRITRPRKSPPRKLTTTAGMAAA